MLSKVQGVIEEPFGKRFAKKSTAQGAIEYLLIIGAAVIIAVIVIALMMGLAGQGTTATEEAGLDSAYSGLMGIKDKHEGAMIITLSFKANTPTEVVVPNTSSGTKLSDLFPSVPNETEIIYGAITCKFSENSWNGEGCDSLSLNPGDDFTITAGDDFEQEIEIQEPEENIIMIYNCEDFLGIENNLGGDYVLQRDIDCLNSNEERREMVPFGFEDNSAFEGTFDGKDKKISNLSINIDEEYSDSTGIFKKAVNATIKNVEISNFNLNAQGQGALIVGEVVNSTVEGITVGDVVIMNFYDGDLSSSYNSKLNPSNIPICYNGCD